MSVRESSSSGFLAALLVTGPMMALVNQAGIYALTVWACGHRSHGVIHVVPVIALVVTVMASVLSYRALVGGDEAVASPVDGTARPSPHLLAISATTIGVFSAAVIIAQWVAVGVYPPCMQS
jgi:hypothetical protein